jgi:hypothetical protein
MCQHQGVQAQQARENSEYVRRLLTERQPEFSRVLQLAERQVDHELSRGTKSSSALAPRLELWVRILRTRAMLQTAGFSHAQAT